MVGRKKLTSKFEGYKGAVTGASQGKFANTKNMKTRSRAMHTLFEMMHFIDFLIPCMRPCDVILVPKPQLLEKSLKARILPELFRDLGFPPQQKCQEYSGYTREAGGLKTKAK